MGGDAPTKEIPLHSAFYETRRSAGAVVHLHATHSVALSMLPEREPDNLIPPLTPYSIMRLGKVQLLPFFVPGEPAMGNAVRGPAGRRSAQISLSAKAESVMATRTFPLIAVMGRCAVLRLRL